MARIKSERLAVLNGTCQGPDSLRAGQPGARVDIRPALELIEEAGESAAEKYILQLDLVHWAYEYETSGCTIRRWSRWNELIDRVVAGMSARVADLRNTVSAFEKDLASQLAAFAAGEFAEFADAARDYGRSAEEMAQKGIQQMTATLEKVRTNLAQGEHRWAAYNALREPPATLSDEVA